MYGYLCKKRNAKHFRIVDAPPEASSEAFALDLKYAKKAASSKDLIRFAQAANDANLSFPTTALKSFEAVVGIEISESMTPKLYVLMRRVMTGAGLSTYAAKNHDHRERPFVINNSKICTPEQEGVLRKVGSFPSGHVAGGWAWVLVFSEIFPDKEKVILKRSHDFGQSRIFCNVHWHSDVMMGRQMGEATIECLRVNQFFKLI